MNDVVMPPETADRATAFGTDAALLQQLLQQLLRLTPASVRVCDLVGQFEQLSEVALAEHGEPRPMTLRVLWERDEPRDVVGGSVVPYVDCPGLRALSGETIRRHLLEVRRGDGDGDGDGGPRVIEAFATPLRDGTGRISGALLLDVDVTERVRIEHALQAQRDQALLLQDLVEREALLLDDLVEDRARERLELEESRSRDRRLSAVGQLAAGVMHDVNNALNPIMAAAYLLRHHAESPTAVRDYADRIRQAAETAAATASRVGRFIRQEPLHAGGDVSIDLSELGNEVLDLTEPIRSRRSSAKAGIQTSRDMSQPVRSRGLPGEIGEALLSLVQNAVDAMPSGGTLTVRTFTDGSNACIAVQDTGIGMNESVRERAFEPFFSTKGAGGTGLGLAEVYGIVRRHRGSATIDSREGQGTTVTLRLPLAPYAPPIEFSTSLPTDEIEARYHVLVVEDHEDGRDFLRRMLESHGHSVEAVGNCADARRALAITRARQYDLLLTDVGLPDGSGWELVAYARAHVPKIRVGVITGWEPMVSADDAVSVEFVLRKPLRAAELLAHISGAIRPAPSE